MVCVYFVTAGQGEASAPQKVRSVLWQNSIIVLCNKIKISRCSWQQPWPWGSKLRKNVCNFTVDIYFCVFRDGEWQCGQTCVCVCVWCAAYSAHHCDMWLVSAGAGVKWQTRGVCVCTGLRLEVCGWACVHVCPVGFMRDSERPELSLDRL